MMSFDNAYPKRKDRRKPFRDSRAVDGSCRHGGRCAWCQRNRQHAAKVRELAAQEQIAEFKSQ